MSDDAAPADAFRDAKGCLTPAGLRAVTDAPLGQAPHDLARHLASCERCQTRLLSGGRRSGASEPPGRLPSLTRGLGLLAFGLMLAAVALVVARWLLPR